MLRRAHPLALAGLLLLAALLTPAVSAAREYLQLFVTEPYLELHTGPGRGYPVFHVVARNASVDVLFRRTDWFKVRTERGDHLLKAGRARRDDLARDGVGIDDDGALRGQPPRYLALARPDPAGQPDS